MTTIDNTTEVIRAATEFQDMLQWSARSEDGEERTWPAATQQDAERLVRKWLAKGSWDAGDDDIEAAGGKHRGIYTATAYLWAGPETGSSTDDATLVEVDVEVWMAGPGDES